MVNETILTNPIERQPELMKLHIFLISLMISVTSMAQGQVQVLSMQERAGLIDRLLEDKLDNTLPELMRREAWTCGS